MGTYSTGHAIDVLPPCRHCQSDKLFDMPFIMAFQPIVDVRNKIVFAYETLVRGIHGEGAASILSQINEGNRYQFDQACRVRSVEQAARLQVGTAISINFLPNAVYQAATCIRATLQAARQYDFPPQNLIFEITENENVVDKNHLKDIIREYKRQGFRTAIDDFGAGYSGLGLLTEFQPDLIKLDMLLIRDIHLDKVRQAIVAGILGVCDALGITVIAEGVECVDEYFWLKEKGVYLFQGYLFARPAVDSLPEVFWVD